MCAASFQLKHSTFRSSRTGEFGDFIYAIAVVLGELHGSLNLAKCIPIGIYWVNTGFTAKCHCIFSIYSVN